MQPTPQQKAVIEYDGDALLVVSGAGTGKTSVLVQYAKANPDKRMLYLCYNKAIQEEAESRFPKNVHCRTAHAIAFARKGKALSHKLSGNLRLTDVKKFINSPSWEVTKDVVTVFNNFLASSSPKIGPEHAAFIQSYTTKQKARRDLTLKSANDIWQASIDPKSDFPCVHDVYLKLYCLSEPEMHQWFSVILFDEAQDANPVISDFVFRQKTRLVLVGDDHQQLYRWRGAENSMAHFQKTKNAKRLIMNKSFRFGPKVARLATILLDYKSQITGCAPFPIEGNETIEDRVGNPLEASLLKQPHTRLHRTVSGTLNTAFDFIQRKLYWIGGIENYNIQELVDVYHFSIQEKSKVVRKKLLSEYRHYEEYKEAADSSGDFEMMRLVKLIEDHGSSLPRKVAVLRKNEIKDEVHADITIGTAHRSKGLEWDTVLIMDDFKDLVSQEDELDEDSIADEINLLYVASTRAMKNLQINETINHILESMNTPLFKLSGDKPKPVRREGEPTSTPQRVRLGD